MDISKVYEKGCLQGDKFRKYSDEIVKKYVIAEESAKDNIAEVLSMDLAVGSEITKVRFISIGIGIGVVGTVTGISIGKKLKSYYDKKQKQKEVE